MEPVTVIVAALSAGAAAGLGDTTADAVRDAYGKLRELVAARLAGGGAAEVALAEHQNDPDTWEAPLARALLDRGVEGDTEVLAAARAVLELLGHGRVAEYNVTVTGSQGVQVGDNARQVNHFGQ
ncbi:hypothetical protein LUW76_35405 [Actinomadura madurae]|uniref:hypothetical protein n=1 Tax=Actinomadura madurae TaxID=1993 RepID=UPI002026026B|nr:hypothetical protein [Actinomadura madurae]URM99192.1 hypothetical protein LUW76_35405 [Actinomadura madurae]